MRRAIEDALIVALFLAACHAAGQALRHLDGHPRHATPNRACR